MKSAADISVEEIRTEQDLWSLEHEWSDLLNRSKSNILFLTHEWIRCWWQYFAQKQRIEGRAQLFVLSLRSNGKLCGIAPFVFEEEKFFHLSLRILRFLGYGPADYSDFIISEDRDRLIQSILEHLLMRRESWDFIELREFYGGSSNLSVFERRARKAGFTLYVQPDSLCRFITIREDWDTFYHSQFNRRRRRDHRREIRNLEAVGQLKFKFFNSIWEEAGLIEIMAQIQRCHPHFGDFRPGDFNVDEYRRFFMKLLPEASRREWLTIALMEVDGRPVSYYLGFRYNGRFYLYSTSHLSDFRKLGVGKFLMMRVFQEYWQSGCHEIDFLRGDEPYKREWTKEVRQNQRLIVYDRSIGSRLKFWFRFVVLPNVERRFPMAHRAIMIASENGVRILCLKGFRRLKNLIFSRPDVRN